MNAVQRRTAVLCLLLAVSASTAAALHVHSLNTETGPNAIHCLICVAAHAPTVLLSAVAPVAPVAGIRGIINLPESDPPSRLLSHDLFIRPPPATA